MAEKQQSDGPQSALLADVLDRVGEGVALVDTEFRCTYVNEWVLDRVGRGRSDLVGEVIWESFPALTETDFFDACHEVAETGEPTTAEMWGAETDAWCETHLFPVDGGVAVCIRDVSDRTRHERALTTVHTSTRAMLTATDVEDICERVVAAATDVLHLTGVVVFRFDEATNRLEPAAVSEDVPALLGDPPTYGPGSSITWHVFAEGVPRVFDDVRESEHVDNPETRIRSGLYIPLGDHGVLAALSAEVGAFDAATVELADLFAANAEAALDRVERESDLRRRDRDLEQQRRRLARLNEMNDVVRLIGRTLVEASTREELERTVCERLVETDRHAFAWVGVPDLADGTLVPRTWAGDGRGYLDDVDLALDAASVADPACVAATTREAVLVANVAEDFRAEPWRKEALAREFQSAFAVPLIYESVLYGVLTVYASQLDAFEPTARDVLDELGRTLGYAINVVETKRGYLTREAVELDIRIREGDEPLARLARRLSCRVTFEGLVPGETESQLYFGVEGAGKEQVLSALASTTAVEQARHVAARNGASLFEAAVTGETFPEVLDGYGAVPKRIVAADGELRAIVDVPSGTDVRGFVQTLRERYATVELVARREREKHVETQRTFQARLDETLTRRQAEVLQAAYLSGYFESPRASTAEEVAASLGIAQPTFTHHLRAAQRKLFELLYA